MRSLITSGSPWEAKMGYSRAVVVNDTIYISATAAAADEAGALPEGIYAQTVSIITALEKVLTDAGFRLDEVVSSRLTISDWENWAEAARAHGEAFGEIRPAFAIVHALPFVDPAILVELELTAVHA
jgi:enamine deaminase RidA (YjgF/YER057c/UK114 family)